MAYRADIEIAVRGAQELKRLQNAILSASDAVNSLNSNLSGVANLVPRSFDNLNRTVAQAARSFNAAALGTKEATDAAREYVRATDAANAGLRERVALLAKVQAGQRRTVPGDAGVGQQTPALPPQLIRTYEIGKNWVKFFQDAAGVAVDLQARALNTKASWNTFFAEAAQLADDLTARTRQRELQISKQGALLRGDFSPIDGSPVTPGGRPIKGSPAFIKQQQERRRQQASGVALGAGFPLLFGGGAGSVIGGALGGLVPGPEGFAAQIALSALGQQLDTFATSLNGLADSLGNPTAALQAFETAGIKVDEAVKVQVENLVKQGEAYKAQQLIFEELTKALGPDAVQQLNAYDKELKNLEDAYKDLSDALIKELLPALTGVLSFIDDFAGRIKKMSETRIFKVLEKAAGFIPSFALSKAQFGAATARGKELAAKQPGTRDLDAETKAEMA